MMNAQTLNVLVEEIIAEVNEEFRHMVIANQTKKGNIQLTLKTRKHYDEYEVEAKLGEVFDYVSNEFNVDFNIINYYKNSLMIEVVEY